jgi:hypothetical protein
LNCWNKDVSMIGQAGNNNVMKISDVIGSISQ